ncbi:MAG: HD domain-containing protein [Chloroflexota bacterium]|nr:HD domain-containing protein [Chloroflexota bacterium]
MIFERNLTREESELIQQIEAFVREKHRHEGGHDYSHILAVTDYAIQIARAIPEEVNPFVLICGALFHDIGWIGTVTGVMHGLRGATVTEEYFASAGVSDDLRRRIKRVVVRHTASSHLPPETVEEKIVWDADGLEALGLIGMLRGIIGGRGSIEDILTARIRYGTKYFDHLCFEETRRIGEKLQEQTEMVVQRFQEALEARKEQIEELELPYVERQPAPLSQS